VGVLDSRLRLGMGIGIGIDGAGKGERSLPIVGINGECCHCCGLWLMALESWFVWRCRFWC